MRIVEVQVLISSLNPLYVKCLQRMDAVHQTPD